MDEGWTLSRVPLVPLRTEEETLGELHHGEPQHPKRLRPRRGGSGSGDRCGSWRVSARVGWVLCVKRLADSCLEVDARHVLRVGLDLSGGTLRLGERAVSLRAIDSVSSNALASVAVGAVARHLVLHQPVAFRGLVQGRRLELPDLRVKRGQSKDERAFVAVDECFR